MLRPVTSLDEMAKRGKSWKLLATVVSKRSDGKCRLKGKTMNPRYVNIRRSLCLLPLAVLCWTILMASVCCGESEAVTTATEELRKIPDLELWVSADDLSGSEGATVTKWPDRTTHHWDLTAAGGKHTLALRAINGRAAVWFDGKQNGQDAAHTARC